MDRLLVTRQRVDAAHTSPDIVSRLEAGVEVSRSPKRASSFTYKALSRSPPPSLFTGASFPSRPSLCALLRYSFIVYLFKSIAGEDCGVFLVKAFTKQPNISKRLNVKSIRNVLQGRKKFSTRVSANVINWGP
jgi:hypothetical protein